MPIPFHTAPKPRCPIVPTACVRQGRRTPRTRPPAPVARPAGLAAWSATSPMFSVIFRGWPSGRTSMFTDDSAERSVAHADT